MTQSVITLGGGCFWCVDAALRDVPGVLSAECGYAGGPSANPTYEQICSGQTGHAEVVKFSFDESVLPLARLLELFFSIHNPTTLNRQGHDVGTQYRSVIYCHSAEQLSAVQAWVHALAASGVYADPIVTEIEMTPTFWPAEEYHQDYFRKNPYQGYCMAVVAPKVRKVEQLIAE